MAQGRKWTTEERENIIQGIRPYLEMGFSRNKACELIGLTSIYSDEPCYSPRED